MGVEQGMNDVLVIHSVVVIVVQISVGLAVVLVDAVVLVGFVCPLVVVEVELELVHMVEELVVQGVVVVDEELVVQGVVVVVEVEVELVPHFSVVDEPVETDVVVDELEVVYKDVVVEAEVVVTAVVVPLPQPSAYGRATDVPAMAARIKESDLCIEISWSFFLL